MTAKDVTPAQIGPYEVVRYLAAGGMADLYLCRDPRSAGHLVVVKRVQSRYLGEPKVVDMFRDEGQIGLLLDHHPNIVRTHQVGEADGYPYIAMEYIEGQDLVQVLRAATALRVAVPRDIGVSICAQVARALSHAHDRRDAEGRPLEIVHCDVSPGNVMLSYRGAVKLVDFGVSRAKIPLHCPERGVAGKYNYMAPEQILGGAAATGVIGREARSAAVIDRRADVFALGVILYELTCGQRLFRGRPEVVMQQVVADQIAPPRQHLPEYPADLEAVVMRALQRDPEHRYPTAEALRVDLVSFLARTGRRHGKQELARFLRAVCDVPADLAPTSGESSRSSVPSAVSSISGAAPPAPPPAAELLRATDLPGLPGLSGLTSVPGVPAPTAAPPTAPTPPAAGPTAAPAPPASPAPAPAPSAASPRRDARGWAQAAPALLLILLALLVGGYYIAQR